MEILNATSSESKKIEYRAKDLIGLIEEIKNLLETGLSLEQLDKLKINIERGLEKINQFFSLQDKSLEKSLEGTMVFQKLKKKRKNRWKIGIVKF